MILSMDIAEMRAALRQQRAAAMQKKGVNIRDVSQEEAVRFLKGG